MKIFKILVLTVALGVSPISFSQSAGGSALLVLLEVFLAELLQL